MTTDNQNDKLRQKLIAMRQEEKEIELIKNKLNQEYANIDKKLFPQQIDEWHKHSEEYFNKLSDQLEANGVILNDAEKKELRRGSKNASSIQEKLEALKKLHIDFQNTASDFIIITCDAIVAAQSRMLKKVDNNFIKSIIKKLTVIDDESKASSKLKSYHAKQYEETMANIASLSEQLNKIKASYS